MFFTLTLEFGRGRKKRREQAEEDDSPYMVVESMGQHERNPIGFSVHDPWERIELPEPEWEEDKRG